jgi:hypothetical protein
MAASKHAVVTAAPVGAVAPAQGPQLVRWGSVFCGTIIGVAVFTLLDALWLALSFGSHDSFVYSNLSWWIGGTAIFCLFLAGLIAGVTSGARGAGAGTMGGLTTWALVLIVVGVIALPTFAIGHVPNTVTVSGHVYSINYLTYWTAFWSVLIGMAAAVLGGAVGGMANRSVDGTYLDLRRAYAEPDVVVPASAAGAGVAAQPVSALAPTAGPPVMVPAGGQPVTTTAAQPVVTASRRPLVVDETRSAAPPVA